MCKRVVCIIIQNTFTISWFGKQGIGFAFLQHSMFAILFIIFIRNINSFLPFFAVEYMYKMERTVFYFIISFLRTSYTHKHERITYSTFYVNTVDRFLLKNYTFDLWNLHFIGLKIEEKRCRKCEKNLLFKAKF